MNLPWLNKQEPKLIIVHEQDWQRLLMLAHSYEGNVKNLLDVSLVFKERVEEIASQIQDKNKRFLFENKYSWVYNTALTPTMRELREIQNSTYTLNWHQRLPQNIQKHLKGFVTRAAAIIGKQ